MKKKTTFLDWATLAAFGAAGVLAYYAIVVIVALLIGVLIATFSEVPWYVAALISFLGIRFGIEGIDAVSGLRGARCTECKRKIKTSKPIKCEECGGAAQLAGKKYEHSIKSEVRR